MIYMTFLKLKQRLKNVYEMTVEKGYEERKKIGVCESLKGGLFLEPCPK